MPILPTKPHQHPPTRSGAVNAKGIAVPQLLPFVSRPLHSLTISLEKRCNEAWVLDTGLRILLAFALVVPSCPPGICGGKDVCLGDWLAGGRVGSESELLEEHPRRLDLAALFG